MLRRFIPSRNAEIKHFGSRFEFFLGHFFRRWILAIFGRSIGFKIITSCFIYYDMLVSNRMNDGFANGIGRSGFQREFSLFSAVSQSRYNNFRNLHHLKSKIYRNHSSRECLHISLSSHLSSKSGACSYLRLFLCYRGLHINVYCD